MLDIFSGLCLKVRKDLFHSRLRQKGNIEKIGIWPIGDWATTLTPSLIGKSEKNNSNERVFWRNDEPMATSQEPVTTWTVTYGQIIYTFAFFLHRKICIFSAAVLDWRHCKNSSHWLWEKSYALLNSLGRKPHTGP